MNAGQLSDVGDVLSVRRDDERRAGREPGEQAGRDEEMRVDDVRLEPAGGRERTRSEPRVLGPAAAPTGQDDALDLVATRLERVGERRDEDAVVGLGGAGVHLRDEQDPRGGLPLVVLDDAGCRVLAARAHDLDPRVDHRQHHVRDQVEEDDRHADHHHHSNDHG